jgi:hypothetical protein
MGFGIRGIARKTMHPAATLCLGGALFGASQRPAIAQSVAVPLTADHWTASNSIRFETHLGRRSLFVGKGVALARDIDVRDGTIEYDMAATPTTNFMGAAFRARALDFCEVVFFRLGSSGTPEAVQYAPALNDFGAAWQIYHGDGANAVAVLPREQWVHVKVALTGPTASVYLDNSAKPILTVPRLAGTDGGGFGVWGGNFGQGAYYSNIRYAIAGHTPASVAAPVTDLPRGTIADWQLSEAFDASTIEPGRLPDFAPLKWESVRVEPQGFVLVNRFRRAPATALPRDPVSHEVLEDSVMGGRVPGTKVVFARATVESDRDRVTRMRFGYSDGLVIHVNGEPLYVGVNPIGFRGLGVMDMNGEAVFIRLRKGRNDVALAVTEYSGGWGFWARLDP